MALIGWLVIPPLVGQVNDFAQKVPDYIDDLTEGRGDSDSWRRSTTSSSGSGKRSQKAERARVFGLSGTAISITKGVLTLVAAAITIIALTYFMLLEGPTWLSRFYSLLAPKTEQRLRGIFGEIGRVVRGYVTGNLFISLIAGELGLVLWALDVPFALALGLLVGLLDLVPLVGATIAAAL